MAGRRHPDLLLVRVGFRRPDRLLVVQQRAQQLPARRHHDLHVQLVHRPLRLVRHLRRAWLQGHAHARKLRPPVRNIAFCIKQCLFNNFT